MKAMLLRGPNTPFELVDLPDPVAGPGEAVARVITCGSGLTIQHVKAGRRKVAFPRVIGHEITGRDRRGRRRRLASQGRRRRHRLLLSQLRPLPLVPRQSRAAVRRRPAAMSASNATAATPSTSSCRRTSSSSCPTPSTGRRIRPRSASSPTRSRRPTRCCAAPRIRGGETVAVIGAGGGVGIHQVMMARWANARVIAVDVAADKFEACRKAGADVIIDPRGTDVAAALRDLTDGQGVDVVVDYVCTDRDARGRRQGARPPRPARGAGRRRAAVQRVGARHAARRAARCSAAATSRAPRSWRRFDLVARREVWPLVTDIRPLEEAEAVHERVERGEVTGRAVLRVA